MKTGQRRRLEERAGFLPWIALGLGFYLLSVPLGAQDAAGGFVLAEDGRYHSLGLVYQDTKETE